jgi:hypothetical protein
VLTDATHARLDAIYQALDPIRLLQQLQTLQDAVWRHAVFRATPPPASEPDVRFHASACGPSATPVAPDPLLMPGAHTTRKYHRTKKAQGPRWWRTRPDPLASVWGEVQHWLTATPERTAKSMFVELQQRYPGHFPDAQLRTLQRRVREWRAKAILAFDDQWLQEDVMLGQPLPPPLQVLSEAVL